MFRTSLPVTDHWFHNREAELSQLSGAIARLREAAPSWVAIVGPRKIGKTSLLLELDRRSRDPSLLFVVLDAREVVPLSLEFFRLYALRAVDQALGPELGESLEHLGRRPVEFRRSLQRSARFAGFPPALRNEIQELPEREADGESVRFWLDLPEQLARACNLCIAVAIDEFEELASLAAQRGAFDPFPLMRSVWQRHERTTYIVSGSARSMLTELVTAEHSPFFQHFSLLDLGPFSTEDAVSLLVTRSPEECPIPQPLARRTVDVIGGHPFYVQLLGEALVASGPPLDEQSLKSALQDLLFSRTGRLALYFENEFHRLVGRATYLAATLQALADGPQRLTDVAETIGAASGATATYLERLGDAVKRNDEGRYELADATFGLWLRWSRPGGTVVPMRLVGDEAERAVAEYLARMGFELVYQSRGSRGAFDLLATRGAAQLGVQVKRSSLPLRFSLTDWNRMEADAERFRWRWVVAAVTPEGQIAIMDPSLATCGQEARLDDSASISNILLWLERRSES